MAFFGVGNTDNYNDPDVVLLRNNEAENKRNTDHRNMVLDWLFPSGGPAQRKNTGLGRIIASVRQRLKDNPAMTTAIATVLAMGVSVGGYMHMKNPSRSRRRRKTKRKKTKRRY